MSSEYDETILDKGGSYSNVCTTHNISRLDPADIEQEAQYEKCVEIAIGGSTICGPPFVGLEFRCQMAANQSLDKRILAQHNRPTGGAR